MGYTEMAIYSLMQTNLQHINHIYLNEQPLGH